MHKEYIYLSTDKPHVVCPPFVSSQLGSSGVILPCSVFADPLPASVIWAYDNAEGQLTSVQVAKGDLDRQSGPYAASYIVVSTQYILFYAMPAYI